MLACPLATTTLFCLFATGVASIRHGHPPFYNALLTSILRRDCMCTLHIRCYFNAHNYLCVAADVVACFAVMRTKDASGVVALKRADTSSK
jgi:hypothetical protein